MVTVTRGQQSVFGFWQMFELHVGVHWILQHHHSKAEYFKLKQGMLLVLFNNTAAALPQ